jgi:hypothetical protein
MASIQPQPVQPDHGKEKKSKSRLSSLFKKDKTNDNDATTTQEPTNPHFNAPPPHRHDPDMLAPDSAYGGSDVGNSTSSSTENVPTITKSAAVAQNMPTKQQFDTASGRVITTTTTTTTTTVTTMGGDHITIPAGREVVVTKDENSPQEMSARPLSKEIHEEELRDHRQQPQYQGGSSGVGSSMGGHSPPIPAKDGRRRRSRSPNTMAMGHHERRLSGDRHEGPVSPSGHQNFSYPARTPPPPGTYGAVPSQSAGPQQGRFSYEDVPVPPIPGGLQGHKGPTLPRVPLNPSHGAHDPNQGSYQPYRQEPTAPQNSSRPRPPMEPSHGQPGLNGEPAREHLPYNRDERPQSTLQSLKFAAAGIHVSFHQHIHPFHRTKPICNRALVKPSAAP